MPSKTLLHAAAVHALTGDYPWPKASARRDWMIHREERDWPDDSGHVTDLDAITPWTNRQATTTRELPRSLVVLGAGPTGVEMSQIYARYGIPMVLVSLHERINPKDHPSNTATHAAALRRDGGVIRTGVRAMRVRAPARRGSHGAPRRPGRKNGYSAIDRPGRTLPSSPWSGPRCSGRLGPAIEAHAKGTTTAILAKIEEHEASLEVHEIYKKVKARYGGFLPDIYEACHWRTLRPSRRSVRTLARFGGPRHAHLPFAPGTRHPHRLWR